MKTQKMKAKLIKVNDYYYLRESYKSDNDGSQCERTLGTTNSQGELGKLSKQNCDKIFGVVDVEKLAKEDADLRFSGQGQEDSWLARNTGIIWGFNKAMELNKDKVFTEKDMEKSIDMCIELMNNKGSEFKTHKQTITQFLQKPTEIEVEIEMRNSRTGNIVKHDSDLEWDEDGLCDRAIPKLNSEGCLILKKI